MALATYTSTVYDNLPKFLPTGDTTVNGSVRWTATSTVGDIGFLAKVPNGAKVVGFKEYHSTGATAQGLSFGFDRGIAAGGAGNASVLIASGAQALTNTSGFATWPNKAPFQISLSDLDPIRSATLIAKVESGTTTTSLLVTFSLTYRFDGPDTR